jgi:hypothetical protein
VVEWVLTKFRKKPCIIDAIQWSGSNQKEVLSFLGGANWWDDVGPIIATLEGEMRADIGDWIIKGVKGEFYPCKPDIFEMTYERLPDDQA